MRGGIPQGAVVVVRGWRNSTRLGSHYQTELMHFLRKNAANNLPARDLKQESWRPVSVSSSVRIALRTLVGEGKFSGVFPNAGQPTWTCPSHRILLLLLCHFWEFMGFLGRYVARVRVGQRSSFRFSRFRPLPCGLRARCCRWQALQQSGGASAALHVTPAPILTDFPNSGTR